VTPASASAAQPSRPRPEGRDLWGDSAAIETALFRNVSRYRTPAAAGPRDDQSYLLKWSEDFGAERYGAARILAGMG
jgi:hypothetical protein